MPIKPTDPLGVTTNSSVCTGGWCWRERKSSIFIAAPVPFWDQRPAKSVVHLVCCICLTRVFLRPPPDDSRYRQYDDCQHEQGQRANQSIPHSWPKKKV